MRHVVQVWLARSARSTKKLTVCHLKSQHFGAPHRYQAVHYRYHGLAENSSCYEADSAHPQGWVISASAADSFLHCGRCPSFRTVADESKVLT